MVVNLSTNHCIRNKHYIFTDFFHETMKELLKLKQRKKIAKLDFLDYMASFLLLN